MKNIFKHKDVLALGILSLVLTLGLIIVLAIFISENNKTINYSYPGEANQKTYVVEPKDSAINKINSIRTTRAPIKQKEDNDDYYRHNTQDIDYNYYDNREYNYYPRNLRYNLYYFNYTYNGTYDSDIYPCIINNKHLNDSSDCWAYRHGGSYQYPYWRTPDYRYHESMYNYTYDDRYYQQYYPRYQMHNQERYYEKYQYELNHPFYDDYGYRYYPNRYYDSYDYSYGNEDDIAETEFWLSGAYRYHPDTKKHLLLNDYYKYHYANGTPIIEDAYNIEEIYAANHMEDFITKPNYYWYW